MVEANKSKYNLLQYFIILFYCLLFIKNYTDDEGVFYYFVTGLSVLIGISLSLWTIFYSKKKYLISNYLYLFLILSVINFFVSNNFRSEDILLTNAYYGLALIPILTNLNYRVFKLVNFIIIAFFGFQMLSGVLIDQLFPRTSRNFVSVMLLICCSYHYISAYQNKKRPSFIIVFLSLLISLWAIGRSGIIVFSLLTVLYPIYLNTTNLKKGIWIFVLSIILFSSFIFFNDLLMEVGFSRFQSMGVESERNEINKDYLDASLSSIKNMLFGPPYESISSIVKVELNPHNSFIRLHTYYGLIGFVCFILLLFWSIKRYFKNRNFLYLFLLIALLIRSYMDSTAFHGPFDPIIYFLIFFNFKNTIFHDK